MPNRSKLTPRKSTATTTITLAALVPASIRRLRQVRPGDHRPHGNQATISASACDKHSSRLCNRSRSRSDDSSNSSNNNAAPAMDGIPRNGRPEEFAIDRAFYLSELLYQTRVVQTLIAQNMEHLRQRCLLMNHIRALEQEILLARATASRIL